MSRALQRPFPVTPVSGMQLHAGPLNVLLPVPLLSLSSQHVHSPENLGAVLSLPSPDAVSVEPGVATRVLSVARS